MCAPSMVPCYSSGVTLRCVRVPRFPQASASPGGEGERSHEAEVGALGCLGGFVASVSTRSPEGGPPLLFAGRRRRSTSPLPGPGGLPSQTRAEKHSTAQQSTTAQPRDHGATVRCRACETASTVSHGPVHVFCRCFRKTHKSHNNGAQGHAGPRRRVLPLLATARAGFVHPLAITPSRHSRYSQPCAQRALCNTRVLCQPSREIGQRRVARRVRVRRG